MRHHRERPLPVLGQVQQIPGHPTTIGGPAGRAPTRRQVPPNVIRPGSLTTSQPLLVLLRLLDGPLQRHPDAVSAAPVAQALEHQLEDLLVGAEASV